MLMRPRDTAPEAHRIQIETARAMSLRDRVVLACELAGAVREAAAAGIRLRHPEYSDEQVKWALFRHWLGDDGVFRDVWPRAPLLAP